MDRFARIILGYHGARSDASKEFAKSLLLGEVGVEDWKPSENEFDWLGHGIYFWEHSPERAQLWAGPDGIVIGAVIQLGNCIDFTDVKYTALLKSVYDKIKFEYDKNNLPMPKNSGQDLKSRKLDCFVINSLVELITGHVPAQPQEVQTVRGAFEEGTPAFEGSGLKEQTHIQVAVRDAECILGIFRPTQK